tara:strand:+ start:267 stop:575 length:309 start_codon:yes stop_codon:yes gene_type:complete
MKKFFIISLILFLILFTAFIKNSTKRMDDQIFVTKENIRVLENEFQVSKLEYTYLSSAKKLINFQSKFFEEDLRSKNSNEIKIIENYKKKLRIKKLEFYKND